MKNWLVIGLLVAPAALGAPRLESLTVKPNPAAFSGGKPPEVEVAVSVSRGKFDSGNCDVSVDPGDGGRARTLDFGVATTRSTRFVYQKGGNYKVTAKGTGRTPCDGMREAALTVSGAPAAKKAEPKKKPEPKKKAEPKKKPEPKKKGAEAPSS